MKENVRERNKKFSHLVSDYVGSNNVEIYWPSKNLLSEVEVVSRCQLND